MSKNLSIFIDESGDFGEYRSHSPYYIVTLVFHNQDEDIGSNIRLLNQQLSDLGYKDMAVHTEPLVRREGAYANLSPNERRAILTKLFFFAQKSPIRYKSFIYEKRQFEDVFKLEARMARDISFFVRNNLEFFQMFDKVILYYDNGQRIINRLLNTVLATSLSEREVRKAYPHEYRLFQVADLICTLKLIEKKLEYGDLSRSESLVFHSKRDFYKDFLRRLLDKEI